MKQIVEILAISVTGILVGAEFAVAAFLNPILGRLPDDERRAARADGARMLGRLMPFWYFAAFALLVAVAVVADSQRRLVGTGVGLMAVAVLLSVAVLVPINNRIAAGEVSTRLVARWDRLHRLRVAILATLFVVLVTGALNA
ncbi:DUF1772 domain-containing protein [Mycolicibacter sinensis]|uniref:DUF1772 domain-containing protein n=1 Tax=Mycolicibacter sinensis (strain JDM601) TaxID=875328 RepID=A0A1A2E2L4_MYCSD|nr:DUF1772 domain-containing protein [Mycolicibacter sinensis]OBF98985.1 hypothetical protein A5772_14255 [Mycolicibacter sinensis]OBG04644.1 hypothetical protein A5771_11195 [Mycolicibacter sinensis]